MGRVCKSCGAELFEAQRFCRGCGRPTDELADESAPTRRMPDPDSWTPRSPVNTAPTPGSATSPVMADRGYYQSGLPPLPQAALQPIPAFVPPRSKSPIGWILAFIGVAAFVLIIVAVMFVARNASRFGDSGRRESSASARTGETTLSRDNADQVIAVGDNQTLIKAFPLTDASKVTLETQSGGIIVRVWDKPQAELKVLSKGSDDRRSPVFYKNEAGNLFVRAGGRSNAQFELNLPRKIGGVDVVSASGSIEIADATGAVSVRNVSGSVEITNVPGIYKVDAVSGDIDITLGGPITAPLNINSVSGEVFLRVKPEVNAELDVTTLSGDIRADDSLGVTVQKKTPGRSATGVIGKGGTRIKINTVSGDVRVMQ